MTPAKILIVEDDLIVARDIQQQLSRLGHVVVGMTEHGEEAVQLALNTRPDLVLMDIRLGGEMDGIEAAQRIRDQVQVPVVYLTAYADDQTLRRARITEPFGYILKPFEDSQLRTAIEMALYKHTAENKLRQSERRYAVTLSSIGDAVIATNETAHITFMNSVAEALTGFPQSEALGLPLAAVFRIFNEQTGERVEDPAAKVLRLGAMVGLANHTVLRSRDDREVAIDDSGSPIIDDSGAIIGVVLVFRDVTQRRLAENAAALLQANARLELALRRSSIGIWEMSPSPEVRLGARGRYANLWERLGYEHTEPFLDLDVSLASVHADDRDRVEVALRAYFSGETPYLDVECQLEHEDGSFRWVLARGATEYDALGKPIRFLGSSVDITDRKQAELALLASERLFRTFVDHALDAFYLHDEVGVILDMNRRACENLGYTREELLGQTPLLYSVRSAAEVANSLAWTGGEEVVVIESFHRRKDGTTFPVEVRLRRFVEGDKTFLVSMVRDTSERLRAEQALRESEERFRGTFDNAGVGIAHCELDGQYLRVNQKLCDILGYSRDELLGANVRATIHPTQDLTETLANIDALRKGEISSYSVDRRMISKSGELVWGNVTVSLQTNLSGGQKHTIAVTQDISERKRLQEELRDAKDAAEAANSAKDEFLANVSHEIRTPMNAILGMTELALDTQLSDNQRQSLKTVKSAAESLMAIIDDLLDFSKIEAGKLQLDVANFRLRSTVAEILRALATRAHRKGLELVCTIQPDVPDALIGDSGRLRQILINLVGNAIKFTTDGEVVVSVSLGVAPAGGVTLRFAIRDTGIGISANKQATIFQAFEQEDTSTTRKYGGTGLGLTIASRLVALMSGEISVVSERDRGSVFAFTANFGMQEPPFPPASAEPPVLLRNMKVLIVDDNTINRHILKEWLRGWQMDPTSVGDGLAAMDALWHAVNSGRPYPLVLLDARMPDTDGLTLAAKIRERAELANTRIILLTSGDRPGDLERFRELRVNAHLLKPVPEDELLDTIYAVMSRGGPELPAPRLPDAAPKVSPPATPLPLPLRVLVVEDNEFNAQLLRQLLLRKGHAVTLAPNGVAALRQLADTEFDLLLLDLHMPEADGFQVIAAIRANESGTRVRLPVIALTARSRREDRQRCLAAGMDDFLVKPILPEDLWSAIDRVLMTPADTSAPESSLLAPTALLAACGGDGVALERLCGALRSGLPHDLLEMDAALASGDLPGLQRVAHRLGGVMSAFSSVAAALASELEDHAARGDSELATASAARLKPMGTELIRLVERLSLDAIVLAGGGRD
jgi:two-component system, sensor histidine kinase and response regulator